MLETVFVSGVACFSSYQVFFARQIFVAHLFVRQGIRVFHHTRCPCFFIIPGSSVVSDSPYYLQYVRPSSSGPRVVIDNIPRYSRYAPRKELGRGGQVNSEDFKGNGYFGHDIDHTVAIIAAEYRAKRLTENTETSTFTYVMVWRMETGFHEHAHMYWTNLRMMLGEADRALDYQWANELRMHDPIPIKKKKTGGAGLSLTDM